ncbi:TRAP transporter substrate-binding protein DctP [Treponema sp. OMZ 840]|uniref:TRAP transporter substrate-binding protein DctP n=1 Tax=Treponema sp. OMZ 840 TaxID=244313 RepID=UPI003D8B022F
MRTKQFTLFFIFGFVLSVLSAQPITVKIASVAPPRSPWDIEQKALAQEWSRLTNGRVELKFYNAGSLGGEGGVIKKMKALRPGQKSPIDGAIFTNIGVYELAPDSHALTLTVPFLFRNQDEVSYALEVLNPDIEKAVNDAGFELLGWFNVGWANFFTKTEIHTPAELKKAKMGFSGIASPGLMAAFKSAGFTMEDIPGEKMLQSIKSANGIKVAYCIPMYAYATTYYTGLTYAIDVPLNPIMSAFLIASDTWKSIPKEYHTVLKEAVRKAEGKFISVQQQSDREYLEKMRAEGSTLVKLTPAELREWERSFKVDAEKMANVPNSVINGPFYKKLSELLEQYRNGNGR